MKKIFLFLLVFFLACPPFAQAKTQTAKVVVDVSAGRYKSIRLKNLPRDSVVKVDIRSDGIVTVLFVTEEQYKEYPNISRPLFQSTVRDRFNFTVTIPAAGSYHLVFDNSTGSDSVKLNAIITGASGSDADLLQGDRGTGQSDSAGRDAASIGTELDAIFVFKPFTLSLKKCSPEASLNSAELVICVEYAKSLSDTLGPQKAATALRFILYHEVGHILLSQWDYPFYDNEETADEFGAMLFALLGRRDQLSGLMKQLGGGAEAEDLLAGKLKGRLHPLTREQAANIVRWVKDNDRLRRWQKIFVPHMKTAMLERIKKNRPAWADIALVHKELTLRKQTVF